MKRVQKLKIRDNILNIEYIISFLQIFIKNAKLNYYCHAWIIASTRREAKPMGSIVNLFGRIQAGHKDNEGVGNLLLKNRSF